MIKKIFFLFFIFSLLAFSISVEAEIWWKYGYGGDQALCETSCQAQIYRSSDYYDTGYYYSNSDTCWCYEEISDGCAAKCSSYDTYYCYPEASDDRSYDAWCDRFSGEGLCSGSYVWKNCSRKIGVVKCPADYDCYCFDYSWDQGCHDLGTPGIQ